MSTSQKPKPTVGMQVFFVSAKKPHENRQVKITKTANKWATLDYPPNAPYRMHVDTWRVDGGENNAYPGECYPTEQDYLSVAGLSNKYLRLRSRMGLCPSEGVTVADVEQAAKLLRIDIEGNV